MNPAHDIVRHRVLYSGHVQGVCFRATAADLAQRWPVVGWVRNRSDGSVELEVEGPAGDVAAFLDAVARRFARNIVDAPRTVLPLLRNEGGFEIRY